MDSIIRFEDFSFRYRDAKRCAVRHLDFEVPEGGFLCVVGPNGSGKSTLCNALVGLVPHHFNGKSRGAVRVLGESVAEQTIAQISCHVGFVFQNPFNQLSYTASTVAEELAYGLGNHGVPREEMVRRIEQIAAPLHLEGLLDRNPLELSGGQVQRVALGSMLIMNPRVLVLDECTTQLDPLGSEEIFDIVKKLNEDGMTVVMVDHDMERVARCADHVLALSRGNQVAFGTPEEVFGSPALEELGIDIPDYVRVSRALTEAGLADGAVTLTEGACVERVGKALGR